MFKRGVLIFLFFLVVIPFSFADLFLDLSRNESSTGSILQGTVILGYEGFLNEEEPLIIKVDGREVKRIPLKELVKGLSNVQVEEASFQREGNPQEEISLRFSERGNLFVGFDLIEERSQDIFAVTNVSLVLKGNKERNSYPRSPVLDLGNDGSIEYSYKGPLLQGAGAFLDLNRTYLKDLVPDFHRKLRGEASDIYCESLLLEPSSRYELQAYVQQLQSGVPLSLALSSFPSLTSCDDEGVTCCSPSTSSSYAWRSCVVDYEVHEQEEKYLCAFVEGGLFGQEYYQIAGDSDVGVVNGYYNGNDAGKDFFLSARWNTFEKELKETEKKITIDPAAFETYLRQSTCPTGRCTLLPLRVMSESAGIVLLKNLQISFETSTGAADVTAFVPLLFKTKKYAVDGDFAVLIQDFEIKSPQSLGRHSLEVSFRGESNSSSFTSVSGPSVYIRANPVNPAIGQIVRFSCLTQNESSATNKTCSWNFGDGSNASGVETQHVYLQEGAFNVSLTVLDKSVTNTRRGFPILVKALKPSLEAQVKNAREVLILAEKNRKLYSSAVQEVSQLLGHDALFSSLSSNLSLLESRFSQVQNETNVSDTVLFNLKEDLDSFAASVPVDLGVNSFQFEGKVSDLDDIPSASSLDPDGSLGYAQVDDFSALVLSAQEDVSVSSLSYAVVLNYANGNEERFTLVKKEVGGSGVIYELLGNLVKKEVYGNYKIIGQNILKFSSPEIVYSLEESNHFSASQAKTLVVPFELEVSVETGSCGDGICDESKETSASCPLDCGERNAPWISFIVLVILLGAGVYYLNWYHGPYKFQDLIEKIKRKKAREYFKNEKDYQSLKKYISSNLGRLDETQMMFVLKKKKWREEQIKVVLKEAKKEKKKV